MKKKVIFIIVTAFIFISSDVFAEYIFIDDGSILKGVIVSETGSTVTLRGEDRKLQRINRSNIMRILYTELYMGKVYVHKNDGKVIVCYMVDEDSNLFTFRYDIKKPEEFKVTKDSVLFIARGNPTALEVVGPPELETVKLKWFPPYNKAKAYKIYLKEKGEKEFSLYKKTSSVKIKLKKLKSNTTYYVIVKAVDKNGEESLPCNEVEFKTENRPPSRVPEVKSVNISKNKNGRRYKVTWNESTDIDGTIVAYRIYKYDKAKKNLVKELKVSRRSNGREYTFKEGEAVSTLIVTAVDEQGSESEDKKINVGK